MLRLRGTNLATGVARPAAEAAQASMHTFDSAGPLLTTDPALRDVAAQDVRVGAGSPAIDAGGGLPAGVPTDLATRFPLDRQPGSATSGPRPRTRAGAADDLGALEYAP